MKRSSIHLDSDDIFEDCSPRPIQAKQAKLLQPAIFSVPVIDGEKYQPVTYEQAMTGVKTRVYADGIFDLFHFGHAGALKQAKNVFPNVEVIVGICNDELTNKMKGKTVMTEEERYSSVSHCRYVDEILRDAPWILDSDFLDSYRIDFVAHDSTAYGAPGTEDIYKDIKAMGRFISTTRTKNISTSDLISRIVIDYDVYIRRNMNRGYTARQLNLGFVKRQEVKIKNKIRRLKKRSVDFIHKCENRSANLLLGFLAMFGRDGRMSVLLNNQKRRLSDTLYPPLPPPQQD
ncbi:Choline-phosphate cytidylyltransferase B-like [Oopsacas minuta]|uniref:choline-phosphate cytidylyltransferase n=1 Tax=Oopsacas minuta TaxID=111878 RepID=A0AAV7K3B6_9METZ|nr:Choline-phosphate cytidylyltransferase B-like [Oopsacas minuta]